MTDSNGAVVFKHHLTVPTIGWPSRRCDFATATNFQLFFSNVITIATIVDLKPNNRNNSQSHKTGSGNCRIREPPCWLKIGFKKRTTDGGAHAGREMAQELTDVALACGI